ncbi:hypothetical protein E2C01_042364 [Portunus trituberculatus]|uniref:Uncharacterized protein n=1 Tax=Portunus trituberculatus TaxID=210409 RepID=A0A5B7FT99_PORTR|nr:hypothetical protein [Portunus trituberculatus]
MEATQRQVSRYLHLAGQTITRWYKLCARDAYCRATGNVGGPVHILQCLLAVTYKLGDSTSRRPCIVHIYHLWAAVEEGHFTWGQHGSPSSPDREVEGNRGIDNVAECAISE